MLALASPKGRILLIRCRHRNSGRHRCGRGHRHGHREHDAMVSKRGVADDALLFAELIRGMAVGADLDGRRRHVAGLELAGHIRIQELDRLFRDLRRQASAALRELGRARIVPRFGEPLGDRSMAQR